MDPVLRSGGAHSSSARIRTRATVNELSFSHSCASIALRCVISTLLLLLFLSQAVWGAQSRPVVPPQPDLPAPLPPSPVDQFREWLRMPVADRDKALAEWPEEKRKVLHAKLRAYDLLPPEERERRLKMLELRWYMRPLMGMAPEQRGGSLNLVPERLRNLVRERLDQWDRLPRDAQTEMLADEDSRELVTRYFAQLQRGQSQAAILSQLKPNDRQALEKALRLWKETGAGDRIRMAGQLAGFFDLPKEEQARTLGTLSDEEQKEMQKTLDAFTRLSPQQRRACVDSFQKFALMSPQERALFLRNAQRWQAMSPRERETWKELVMKLPPLPPEPLPVPPMPEAKARTSESFASTNPPVPAP